MFKRCKDAVTVSQGPSRLWRYKDKALTSLIDRRADNRLHAVVLPKTTNGMLHYCTQTMPPSEDDKITGGAQEGRVSDVGTAGCAVPAK